MSALLWFLLLCLVAVVAAVVVSLLFFRGGEAPACAAEHAFEYEHVAKNPAASPRAILRRGGFGARNSDAAELLSVFSSNIFTLLSQPGVTFPSAGVHSRGANCPPGAVKVSDMSIIGVSRSGVMAPLNLDLCFKGVMTCFGQNPASPYTGPRWLSHTNMDWVSAGGGVSSEIGDDVAENVLGTFTLADDQAVVVYGQTPPESVYYALTPYVYTTPSCGSTVVFATAADSTNNNDLRGDDGQAFNQPFAVIYSSNLTLGAALRDVVLSTSSSDPRLNARPDPSRVIFVPIKRQAPGTTYVVVGRVAGFATDALRDQYLANTRMRISLLTGSAHFRDGPFQTTSVWKPRATQGDERLDPGEDALKTATANVARALTKADYVRDWTPVASELYLSGIGYDNGDDCLRACAECRGDNRDTVYRLVNFGEVGLNEVLLVVGVNHNRTGKSTYTNFTVYDADQELGLDSVDVYNTAQQWNLTIISRRDIDLPEDVRNMNPRVIVLPDGVKRVYVAERAYVQTLGSPNISAAPDTLLPFRALRGTMSAGGCGASVVIVAPHPTSVHTAHTAHTAYTAHTSHVGTKPPVYATPVADLV